jgi:hypothetical protein
MFKTIKKSDRYCGQIDSLYAHNPVQGEYG